MLRDLDHPAEAILRLQEAIPLFHDSLTHGAGGLTVEACEQFLQELQSMSDKE